MEVLKKSGLVKFSLISNFHTTHYWIYNILEVLLVFTDKTINLTKLQCRRAQRDIKLSRGESRYFSKEFPVAIFSQINASLKYFAATHKLSQTKPPTHQPNQWRHLAKTSCCCLIFFFFFGFALALRMWKIFIKRKIHFARVRNSIKKNEIPFPSAKMA